MNAQSRLLCFFFSALILIPAIRLTSQTADRDPPLLAHQPLLVGVRGEANVIEARAADPSGIASVRVTLYAGERSATGDMPRDDSAGVVPVTGRVINQTPLLAEPHWFSRSRGDVRIGFEIRIAGSEGNYYRVATTEQDAVFIDRNAVSVDEEGSAYRLVLPAKFCTGAPLGYRITVTDAQGNEIQTDRYDISFPETQVAAQTTTRPVRRRPGEFRPNVALLFNAGTLGGGGGIGYRFQKNLGIRGTWNYFKYGIDGVYEDIDEPIAYDVNLSLNSGAVLLDYYPWGRGLHLTGGVLYNKNRINGSGIPAENIEANNTVYTPAEVGELRLSLQSREEWTPYIGFGIGTPVPTSGLSVWLDIGGVYMGSPDVDLGADEGTMIYPTIQNEAQMEADLENLKWYIAVVLGLSFAL